jgi:hypothetical protein
VILVHGFGPIDEHFDPYFTQTNTFITKYIYGPI